MSPGEKNMASMLQLLNVMHGIALKVVCILGTEPILFFPNANIHF